MDWFGASSSRCGKTAHSDSDDEMLAIKAVSGLRWALKTLQPVVPTRNRSTHEAWQRYRHFASMLCILPILCIFTSVGGLGSPRTALKLRPSIYLSATSSLCSQVYAQPSPNHQTTNLEGRHVVFSTNYKLAKSLHIKCPTCRAFSATTVFVDVSLDNTSTLYAS